MAAAVAERPDAAILLADDDDFLSGKRGGDEVARLLELALMRDIDPGAGEDALDLEGETIDRLYVRKAVARVRSLATHQEWRILWHLANGESYEGMARAEGLSVSALKTKVSRCRSRLKRAAA